MIIAKLLGWILLLLGMMFIFFARAIIVKYINFGSQNDVVFGLKVVGLICLIIGLALIYFIN